MSAATEKSKGGKKPAAPKPEAAGKKAAPKDGSAQVAPKFSADEIQRIDRHRHRMTSMMPGVSFSRTDAVKQLVLIALETAEGQGPESNGAP